MKPKRNRLSNIQWSSRKFYLTTILIFILGLLLGLTIILAVPMLSHRAALLRISEERGRSFLLESDTYDRPSFGMDSYIYTEKGNLIYSARETFLKNTVQSDLAGMVPAVLNRMKLYTIKVLPWGENNRSGQIICIIAGTAITDGSSGARYASFLIRDLKDLDITLPTFVGLYAILFISAIILIRNVSKQHKNLLNIQRDLVSNVGHELKTPITSIKAIAEMINDGMIKDETELRRYTSYILDEADRLDDLVREILELSKLQNDKLELKKENCSAEDIFTPVIDRFKMMAADMGITLDASGLQADQIPTLYTDPNHIARVLGILLENSVKFTGTGGTIRVSSDIQNIQTVFCVSDNGPGIAQEDLDRIFERFYKGDLTHNTQGSGLGLAIASETLKGLNEKIWVESALGKGAAFYFTVSHK